ncbi:MAG TPA: SDR family oxidoreductase [Acidimicrobiales bacterium]|nr:SDR family oxidoreductase [Acidimicrobiales bacterium]
MSPVALVTGASRGIGRASAIALGRAGFDVVVTARTLEAPASDGPAEDLRTTAAAVEAAGSKALALASDLLDFASLDAVVATTLEHWGRVDVLVNDAVDTGPGSMEHFVALDLADVERKLRANVLAQLVLIKAVLPGMLERGEGTIVNISSAVATSDPPAPAGAGGWGLGYAASKGAFHRVAGILAVELGSSGIFAVNVDPGYVVTERMAADQERLGLAGRYPGAPPSVPASVVAWLAGGASAAGASGPITEEERRELNGTTVLAQRVARQRSLHPPWR